MKLLVIAEVINIFKAQKCKCAISGLPIRLGAMLYKTASLDRIDSSKGYVISNVQWVHKDINRMKNNFNQEYFVGICKIISEFNNVSKECTL